MNKKERIPVSPGEVLYEEFMKPYGLTQNALGRAIKVPPARINQIIMGKRALSPDTALRLSRYFCTTPEFWIGLQTGHELALARNKLGKALNSIIPLQEALDRLKKGVPLEGAGEFPAGDPGTETGGLPRAAGGRK